MREGFFMLSFVVALGVVHAAKAENPKLSIEYQLSDKDVVFTIQYQNPTSDTLVFWIQNWRLILLKDPKVKFRGFPYMSKLANYTFFLDKSIDLLNQLSDEEYYSSINGEMASVCMKKLDPKETFVVEIVSKNEDLIGFIKKESFKITSILSYAKITDLRKNGSFSEALCVDSNLLKLEDLPITGNGLNEIRTWDFAFSERVINPLIPYHNYGDGFHLYIVRQVPVSRVH
ncbi:hypothetical protein [Chryseolinea serpens]|nr:hypothetical protein [Chryseolinea serpens]